MVPDIAGARAGRPARRWAGMLLLEFARYLTGSMLARRGGRQCDAARQRSENDDTAQRHDRENASISVTAAPPSIPSIAARHTSFRVGSRASWTFMKSRLS